jgi:hypothetical protein
MTLLSQQFLTTGPDPELQAETGWDRVRKAINLIVFGNLIMVLAVFLFIGVLVLVALTAAEKPTTTKVEKVTEALVVMLTGTAICGFVAVWGYVMVLKGEWGCLMGAPERCYARWFMFAAITCLLIGPVSGFITGFLVSMGPPPPAMEALQARMERNPQEALRWMQENQDEFWESMTRPYVYVRACSALVALLGNVFFILFLRAVNRCWDDDARTQLVDLYLMFTALLGAAPIIIGLASPKLLTNPALILALGGGGLLDYLWYLFVLIATSGGISAGLERQAAALAAARMGKA